MDPTPQAAVPSENEKKPQNRLKRYIKNHDEDYVKKRKEYSMQPEVKQRRYVLNRRRRHLCSVLIQMAKHGMITDSDGNTYKLESGRLIQNGTHVVKIDKLGSLHLEVFKDRIDLEREELDIPIETEEDKRFKELLEKYKRGDLIVEFVPKGNIHINVNERGARNA